MAWIFEIEADCVEEDAAKAFGNHFLGIAFALPDGRECRIGPKEISYFKDEAHHIRCCIVPTGASLTGRQEDVLENDNERKKLALFLYDHLRAAPPFRFAIIGVEHHEFNPFERDGMLAIFGGLVVSEQMLAKSGHVSEFQPFSPGYFWVPLTEDSKF